MKTVFSIVFLIVCGAIANFVFVIILNIAGFPGASLTTKPKWRSKGRIFIGSIISALGQSYIYLAYVAFITNWTTLAARRNDVVAFLIWPFAFLAVVIPVLSFISSSNRERSEQEFSNPNYIGLHITSIIVLVGFFAFAFAPIVKRMAWGWVPYKDVISLKENEVIRANVDNFFIGLEYYSDACKISYKILDSNVKEIDVDEFDNLLEKAQKILSTCNKRLMNSVYDNWGNIIHEKIVASISLYLSRKTIDDVLRGEGLRQEAIAWLEKNVSALARKLKKKYSIDMNESPVNSPGR